MSEAHPRVEPPAAFDRVLADELVHIDARRAKLRLGPAEGEPPPPDSVTVDERRGRHDVAAASEPAAADSPAAVPLVAARKRRLVGLSFSGGGIRSATFNLGLLQGLADLGLLKFIDYLSTVSGGGYIGSWLAANVRRSGGVEAFEKQLRTSGAERTGPGAGAGAPGTPSQAAEEPEPVRHLRRYSNYLAPRKGFFSADTWVLGATYLRNFLLSQCVVLPAVVAVLLLSRLALLSYYPWDLSREPPHELPATCFGGMAALVVLFWGFALVNILHAAAQLRAGTPRLAVPGPPHAAPASMTAGGMVLRVVLPLSLSALCFCWFAAYREPWKHAPAWLTPRSGGSAPGWRVALGVGAAFAALATVCYLVAMLTRRRDYRSRLAAQPFLIGVAALTGFVGGVLLFLVYRFLNGLYDWESVLPQAYIWARAAAAVTTFGPPLVLVAMVLALFLSVGLLKHRLGEEQREWWSGLCARLLLAALIWSSVNLIALYGTALVLWAGPWARAALGSGWLLTVAAGVLAGGGARTEAARPRPSPLDRLARLAPHVFLAGLLVGVSLLIHAVIDNPPRWEYAPETTWPRTEEPERPPIRVSETRVRTIEEGKPTDTREVQAVTERRIALDEAELAQELYWLGILNTEPAFVPKDQYQLEPKDIDKLRAEGFADNGLLSLKPLEAKGRMDRSKFLEALDKALPVETPVATRLKIIRYAKDPTVIQFYPRRLFGKLGLWLLGCLGVILVATWCVDVNLFSMHSLYGNRLVRCYLGASRPDRAPDPVTELDARDDLCLADLRIAGAGAAYDGPYLIVNAALNLVRGDRLDWQDRKAESFVLTALYCGSQDTGYRPTAEGDPGTGGGYGGNFSLGRAVTLSGAAASPNMGYNSSPAVTALLTVFNARLGAWVGNPASPTRWRRAGPAFGFLHLFRELFGWTRARGGYVYLSDGGHFENLGAYELIRRRCRYVIVSDGGQDGDHVFEDLSNLIRKCRTDFGIRIEIDLGSLRRRAGEKTCRWHCAVGKIRYDDVDPRAAPGTLVYVKPCLTGDEPADVLQYAERYPHFPHESTANQFFTEAQFESYRALGQHVAEAVFAQSVEDMDEALSGKEAAGQHVRRCRALFASIVRRWFAMPPEYETTFLDSTKGFIAVQEALRGDPRLWRLTLDLYPELDPEEVAREQAETATERVARRAAEVHTVVQMLQVMENAWLSLRLDVHYAHPLNRGWMEVFHRWTRAPTVRGYWPAVRGEFGRGFVSFCEKQMKVGVVKGEAVRLAGSRVPQLLAREFRDEWPKLDDLQTRLAGARHGNAQLAWLIRESRDAPSDGEAEPRVPCGIVLVSPSGPGAAECDFLVWLRGAYRNSGLGRTAVRQVIEELRELWPQPFRLRVRLPVADLSGPGGKLLRAMWLTFFQHHDFVRVQSLREAAAQAPADVDVRDAEVVLERTFPRRE